MKAVIAILALGLIAAIAGVFFFWQKNKEQEETLARAKAEIENSSAALISAREQSKQKAIDEAAVRRQAQLEHQRAKEAAEAAERAAQAAKLAEAKVAQEEAERKARMEALNARLAAEAKAREEAETAAAALEEKMKVLQATLKEAETKQQEFLERQQALADSSNSALLENQKILEDIERRRLELAQIEQERVTLSETRDLQIEKQIEIEEEILNEGWEITVPNYRIWSPNYRPIR